MQNWLTLGVLARWNDAALVFARLATGIFLVDGVLDNILSRARMAEFVGFLTASGFAMPGFWAPFSVYTQFAIGAALIVGLLTRWAALGLIVTFVVGIVMVHLNQSLREIWPALALVAIGAVFATHGAGRWSLDRWLERRQVLQTAALIVLIAAALWLAWAGGMMALRPDKALALLRRTAESPRANITEQGPRMLAGAALIVRAPLSAWPFAFTIAGWFVVVTSAILLIVPLRWHAGYAIWWADRTPHGMVRIVGPFSIAAGMALVAAAL